MMTMMDEVLSDLTRKEREEVLPLLLEGWKNEVIARKLSYGSRTNKSRTITQDVYRICDKFSDNKIIDFKGMDKRAALMRAFFLEVITYLLGMIVCLLEKMQQQGETKAD